MDGKQTPEFGPDTAGRPLNCSLSVAASVPPVQTRLKRRYEKGLRLPANYAMGQLVFEFLSSRNTRRIFSGGIKRRERRLLIKEKVKMKVVSSM